MDMIQGIHHKTRKLQMRENVHEYRASKIECKVELNVRVGDGERELCWRWKHFNLPSGKTDKKLGRCSARNVDISLN